MNLKKLTLIVLSCALGATAYGGNQTQCLKDNMVGKWAGVANTPWVTSYSVEFEFKSDGTYSSKGSWGCIGKLQVGDACLPHLVPALYYGTDRDGPEKVYRIENVVNGVGEGSINVLFDVGTVVADELKYVRLVTFVPDDSGQGVVQHNPCSDDSEISDELYLQFKMYHLRNYGPLTFSLRKVN